MKTAPDFTLQDQFGETHSLSDYKGKWVLIYFYPKDDTPGCTKEACGFRDGIEQFKEEGIVVFGISKDSIDSHKQFADKYRLPFSLLSDPHGEVVRAYGAHSVFGVRRISFLVGPDQTIKKEYLAIDVVAHAQQILRDKQLLQQKC